MATDRYEFIKRSIIKGKGKVLNTARMPLIPPSPDDRFIFSRIGDRLDNLAFQFYGDPRHWIVLAIANKLGKGSLNVPANIQLRIPPQTVITDLRELFEVTEEER